jgi:hypothetical protein
MRNIIYILLICLGLWSCEDFLNREPVEQVSISQQFSSVEGLREALNGAYRRYEEIYSEQNFFVYADAVAGNFKFAPNRQGIPTIPENFQQVYSFQEDAEEGTYNSTYQNFYSLINALNLILENIDEVPDLANDLRQQVIAETLAMRASAHFELTKLFAQMYNFTVDAQHLGIVYNTRTLTAGEDFPSRATLADSYDLIEADFLEALNLFTDNQALQGPETSYFNALNVSALLSRFYLYKGDWQSAIEQANLVLNSGVQLTPRDLLITEWANFEPLSEALFEFTPPLSGEDSSLVTSSISDFFNVIFLNDEVVDFGRYTASNDLVSLYDENDIRALGGLLFEQEISTETSTGAQDLPYIFTRKFPANDGAIMIRLSEVFLNRAEAYAQTGQENPALSDLQTIRLRANPNAPQLNLSGQELIDEILLERRRELAFERHLVFDLARNGQSIERNDGCNISICQLDYPNDRFIMPIPLNALEINQNMQQNEGY